MCTHTWVCICVHMYLNPNTCVDLANGMPRIRSCLGIAPNIHVFIYIYKYVCMYVCIHVHLQVCMYVCVHIHADVCMCTYVCVLIHAYV